MTKEEFDDYRDMRNPNGHPDRIKGNMVPHTQPLLDIRHHPDGSVVIKRYPFETVFNMDEWKELLEYCVTHSSRQSERESIPHQCFGIARDDEDDTCENCDANSQCFAASESFKERQSGREKMPDILICPCPPNANGFCTIPQNCIAKRMLDQDDYDIVCKAMQELRRGKEKQG